MVKLSGCLVGVVGVTVDVAALQAYILHQRDRPCRRKELCGSSYNCDFSNGVTVLARPCSVDLFFWRC